ncbi:MAG: hypothetical protein ACKO96_12480 [Flammeovirgaceae bacterium]
MSPRNGANLRMKGGKDRKKSRKIAIERKTPSKEIERDTRRNILGIITENRERKMAQDAHPENSSSSEQ